MALRRTKQPAVLRETVRPSRVERLAHVVMGTMAGAGLSLVFTAIAWARGLTLEVAAAVGLAVGSATGVWLTRRALHDWCQERTYTIHGTVSEVEIVDKRRERIAAAAALVKACARGKRGLLPFTPKRRERRGKGNEA